MMEDSYMPNKTIYVADHDLPLFDQAQEIAGGNLSAAITHALRRYVEQEGEAREGEIIVRVGTGGAYVQQRFQGRLLGKQSVISGDQTTVTNYRLYLTRKGNYAVHRKDSPNWTRRNWGNIKDLSQWMSGDAQWWQPVSKLEVYNALADLRDHIPAELFAVATQQNNGEPVIEDLDI